MASKRSFSFLIALFILVSIYGCEDRYSIDSSNSDDRQTIVSEGSETLQTDETPNTTPPQNDNHTVGEAPSSDTGSAGETPWPETNPDGGTTQTVNDSNSETNQTKDTGVARQTNDGKNSEHLDVLTFGDTSSELSHELESLNSEVVNGGLDQPARRLLPMDPVDLYGGYLTFKMTIDPKKRNYVSVKFWGDEGGDAALGRIYLYVIQDGREYQVAYRHEGDYVPLTVAGWGKDLPGRFFYSTTMLPLEMTRGKASITLRLVSTGRLYGLGKGGPPDGNYQFPMDRPSRTLYRAYTHTGAFLNVSDETQAQLPESKAKPGPGEEVLQAGGEFRNRINEFISARMNKAADSINSGDLAYLGKAYNIPELDAYQSEALLEKVVAAIDAHATHYYTDPDASGWGGRYGSIGKAIHYLSGVLEPYYDTEVDYGEGGTLSRRQAWGDMLFASREFGRLTRSERSLTNQAMIANDNIYMANKGLLHLEDARAFAEEDAQRYIKEACGLLPWLGSDMPDDSSFMEFGANYYLVTKKGQTRERGYVGDSYGEMTFHVAEWYEASGNEAFREQAIKMLMARAPFRRPSVELMDGNAYRIMKSVSPLSWRGAPESDGELVSAMSYADRGQWALGIRVPGATEDPTLIGYARHMLEDNRYFESLLASTKFAQTLAALDVFEDYRVVQQTADTGDRLPMADSLSDFAWADEENAIMALKHGDERLWVSAYWQAKYGINSVARFLYSTPGYEQYGVMETVPQFQTKEWYTRPSYRIDKPEGDQWAPPNPPLHAYGNELLPINPKPEDARSSSPFCGKADFYSFRFGHFLAGINTHPSRSYELKATNDLSNAKNLFTGEIHMDSVSVAPQSSMALYLDAEADAEPQPGTPMWIHAIANGTEADISWNAASGADHYTVERAMDAQGPFEVVGQNIETTQFKDNTLPAANTTYFYRVIAHSNGGPGYPSAMATPLFSSLPDGWSDSNIGDGSSGTTLHDTDNDELVVTGTGWDIGSMGDSFHFTHKTINGDATLVAKVTGKEGGTSRNKVGLMVRESLGAGSKTAIVMLSSAEGYVRFAARGGNNQSMSYQNYPAVDSAAPKWLKIERIADVIIGYVSEDGENWQQAAQANVTMQAEAYIGFAVAPRSSSSPVEARFKIIE